MNGRTNGPTYGGLVSRFPDSGPSELDYDGGIDRVCVQGVRPVL